MYGQFKPTRGIKDKLRMFEQNSYVYRVEYFEIKSLECHFR